MKPSAGNRQHTIKIVSRLTGRRAGNLFMSRQLWCSGSVLVAVNRALGGDLTRDQAIRLAAGLGDGLGSGCICGGLNGAALCLGLFLGSGRLSPGGDQKVLEAARKLHDQFKKVHGSACCRVLLKKDPGEREAQYRACAQRTAMAAGLCTEQILMQRPKIISTVDWDYLNCEDSAMGARIKIVADHLRH